MSEPSSPDIVAELDRWCTDWNGAPMADGEPPLDGLHCDTLRRARDEIVAQRAAVTDLTRANMTFLNALYERRDEALEEAALALETMGGSTSPSRGVCAFVIRALKNKT